MPFFGNINSLVTRLSLEPHKSKTGKQDKKEKGKEKDFGSPVVPWPFGGKFTCTSKHRSIPIYEKYQR